MSHELLLLTGLHDNSNPGDKISGLLPNLGRFIVQPPENGSTDLWQVWFDPFTQTVNDSTESVQHNYILGSLFLQI